MSDQSVKRTIAVILAAVVAIAVYILNAVFTYTYGTSIIGPFLLVDYIGVEASAILSGIVAVLFFDISYLVGLAILLFAARSMLQYGSVGIQFALCFLFSLGASIVSLILRSDLGNYVDANTLLVAQYAGYAMLVAGFVVNALAGIGYIFGSPENMARIKHSVREATTMARQDHVDNKLDRESELLASQLVTEQMPTIAAIKARNKLAQYLAVMGFEPEIAPTAQRALPAGNNQGHGKTIDVIPLNEEITEEDLTELFRQNPDFLADPEGFTTRHPSPAPKAQNRHTPPQGTVINPPYSFDHMDDSELLDLISDREWPPRVRQEAAREMNARSRPIGFNQPETTSQAEPGDAARTFRAIQEEHKRTQQTGRATPAPAPTQNPAPSFEESQRIAARKFARQQQPAGITDEQIRYLLQGNQDGPFRTQSNANLERMTDPYNHRGSTQSTTAAWAELEARNILPDMAAKSNAELAGILQERGTNSSQGLAAYRVLSDRLGK